MHTFLKISSEEVKFSFFAGAMIYVENQGSGNKSTMSLFINVDRTSLVD